MVRTMRSTRLAGLNAGRGGGCRTRRGVVHLIMTASPRCRCSFGRIIASIGRMMQQILRSSLVMMVKLLLMLDINNTTNTNPRCHHHYCSHTLCIRIVVRALIERYLLSCCAQCQGAYADSTSRENGRL